MHYTNLGRSSLQVSRIAMGTMQFGDTTWREWMLDGDASLRILHRAVELGINFFDSCDFYSGGVSEEILGRLIATGRREDLVVATKFGNPMGPGVNSRGYSRKHMRHAVEESLRRLGTDYIDLYQTHIWDPRADVDELMETAEDLRAEGKILHFGMTDVPAWQFAKAHYSPSRARPAGGAIAAYQGHYNLLWREYEREVIPMCEAENVAFLAYSPLARGLLAASPGAEPTARARTDEYRTLWYDRHSDRRLVEAVHETAARHGISAAQLALGWVLRLGDVVVPVVGPTSVAQLDELIAALDIEIDAEAADALGALYEPRPRAGH